MPAPLAGTSPLPRATSHPPINGGVIELAAADAHGIGGPCRLDKYHATVYLPVSEVIQELKARWHPSTDWIDQPFTGGNYARLLRGRRWEDEVQVKYGGQQHWPNVASKLGPLTPVVATLIRQWPHRVTRADAKIDIQGPGAFDWLVEVANKIRSKQRIVPKVREIRDLDGIEGRSVYIGSSDSEFECCIYDKTLQMLHAKRTVIPPHIVRVEGRYRPNSKEAGMAAAKLKSVDYFGVSGWGREFYEAISGEAIEPVPIPRNGAGTLEMSLLAMVAQYRKHLELLVEREGSWAKAGEYLEYLVPEAEELVRDRMEKQRSRNAAVKN